MGVCLSVGLSVCLQKKFGPGCRRFWYDLLSGLLKKGLKCFIGRGVNYIHNYHGSLISRLVKNISTVTLVLYCEIHSHDSCVYTKTFLEAKSFWIQNLYGPNNLLDQMLLMGTKSFLTQYF